MQNIEGNNNEQKVENNYYLNEKQTESKALLVYRTSAVFIAFVIFYVAIESVLEKGLNPVLELIFLISVPICLGSFAVHIWLSHFKKK